MYQKLPNGNEEFTLYGAQGEKLGVYAPGAAGTAQASANGTVFGLPGYYFTTVLYGAFCFARLRSNVYFAGKICLGRKGQRGSARDA